METFTSAKDTPLTTRVLELLQNGHQQAIGLKDLCKRLASNERKVRLAIEALRREGWQILISGSGQGYFIGETKEELDEFIRYMSHRMMEEYRTFRYVKNATKKKLLKQTQLPLIY
jgi:biotin operon repressor